MGVSHLIFAPGPDENEGLMVDVDGGPNDEYIDELRFEIGLGRWSSGSPSFGFNAAISGLTFEQFSQLVDRMTAVREKYKLPPQEVT